jgi:hypothetical protein
MLNKGADVLNRVIRAVSQQHRFNHNRLPYPAYRAARRLRHSESDRC